MFEEQPQFVPDQQKGETIEASSPAEEQFSLDISPETIDRLRKEEDHPEAAQQILDSIFINERRDAMIYLNQIGLQALRQVRSENYRLGVF